MAARDERNGSPPAFLLALGRPSFYCSPMSQNLPIRLNKYLAEAGISSRRGADDLIQAGRVEINGQVQREPGVRITPGVDHVRVNGKEVQPPLPDNRPEYIILNKPVHTVTTVRDPQGRRTVLDLLPEDLRARRLFPVGRLDYMSEGLLLLTNDGEITLRLTHPRHEHPKIYEVLIRERVSEQAQNIMRSGMRLKEGERLAPVDVTAALRSDGATLVRMTLRQGVNRQIRRMCRDLGLTILRLRRVAIATLELGDLESGQWRALRPHELSTLKAALGLGA